MADRFTESYTEAAKLAQCAVKNHENENYRSASKYYYEAATVLTLFPLPKVMTGS